MQQNISSKEASIGIRLSYCQPMYILANLPIQFQHLRLISKHPQMLVNDILIIAHSRSCLCGKRFQLMHLAGRLVYQGEHCLERQPVLFQQFSSQHIHVIGKIARKHSRQMQTFALLRTCFIHVFPIGRKQCPSEAAHPLPSCFPQNTVSVQNPLHAAY